MPLVAQTVFELQNAVDLVVSAFHKAYAVLSVLVLSSSLFGNDGQAGLQSGLPYILGLGAHRELRLQCT